MASVTYDGQSFMLDGRRIWLVSGSVQYARIPRAEWRDRIHAAKLTGLNCIETPIFWNRHEQLPGQFDFTGDNDVRHFVELIADAGMYCILRPGPYVGAGADAGGLPPWLLRKPDVELRTANGPFLQAASRYISALAEQIRDLQITSAGSGGPIILIQNESGWTCGHNDLGAQYLGELSRYLREAGLTVPNANANNLWQGVEGEVDAWVGSHDLYATMRQLAAVRPDQPRLVIDLETAPPATWTDQLPKPEHPMVVQRRIAEALASGSQFNLSPLHGGTDFAYGGGRLVAAPDAFAARNRVPGAPLTEAGAPGETWQAVRRICTFASQFGRVLAHLDPAFQPVSLVPDASGKRGRTGFIVTHAKGTQGSVVFVFGDAPGVKGAARRADILLPDGSSLPVAMGSQSVVWCLLDAHLDGRAHLDYCNLSALALLGRVFVCYGPPGAEAHLSINGSPLVTEVPRGRNPEIISHESVTLVICSEKQVDTTYVSDAAVYVGVCGLGARDESRCAPGYSKYTRIDRAGTVTHVGAPAEPLPRVTPKLATDGWLVQRQTSYADGTSARFAAIHEPADLTTLGAGYGYGWYRIELRAAGARKAKMVFPESGDRLQVLLDGQSMGVVGAGPGAEEGLTITLSRGTHNMVLLAENLGRFSEGDDLGRRTGLYGHFYEAKAFRAGRASVESCDPVDLLSFRAPMWGVRQGDLSPPERLTWRFMHRRKSPIIMTIGDDVGRSLVLVNNEPVHVHEPHLRSLVVLANERLIRGGNTVQLAPLSADPDRTLASLASSVNFIEAAVNVTEKAGWAFAKWQEPAPTEFTPAAKSDFGPSSVPTWWKCPFTVPDSPAPLMVDLSGMTKGQIYINGRHLGRYFVALRGGKPVTPDARVWVPGSWLKSDRDNELVLFDEHGGNPGRIKLSTDSTALPIRA